MSRFKFLTAVTKEKALEENLSESLSHLYVLAHLKGFSHSSLALDLALFVCTHTVDDAHFLCTFHALGIATEAGESGIGRSESFISGGYDIIEFLILNLKLTSNGSVNQSLELCIDGIEVHGACENENVGIDHLLKNLRHIVLDSAHTCATASVAGTAVADLLFRDTDFFDLVSGFRSTSCEFVAEDV